MGIPSARFRSRVCQPRSPGNVMVSPGCHRRARRVRDARGRFGFVDSKAPGRREFPAPSPRHNPAVVGFGTVLLTGLNMMVFKIMYLRRPTCGQPIPSGGINPQGAGATIGSRCDKCKVDFGANIGTTAKLRARFLFPPIAGAAQTAPSSPATPTSVIVWREPFP
jgi:hypothetical protein